MAKKKRTPRKSPLHQPLSSASSPLSEDLSAATSTAGSKVLEAPLISTAALPSSPLAAASSIGQEGVKLLQRLSPLSSASSEKGIPKTLSVSASTASRSSSAGISATGPLPVQPSLLGSSPATLLQIPPLPNSTGDAKVFSWSDLVQGANQKLQKKGEAFTLDSGETCVTIPNDVIKRNHHRWDDFIIVQFNGKAPSPGALHAITNGIWSPKLRNISVSKLTEKAFLIKIPSKLTRKKVLDQGMWHVEKQAMFVAKWEPGLQPELPELISAPVWLEFRNVPPHFFSPEGLGYIAGLIGEPLYLHPSTANMVNLEVAKVFTVINPTKPLPEAVNVRFETGFIQRIEVSSPWLPPTCEHCNTIGHSIRRCPTAPITCSNCKSTSHPIDRCPQIKTKKAIVEPVIPAPETNKKKRSGPSKETVPLPSSTEVRISDTTLIATLKQTAKEPQPSPPPESNNLTRDKGKEKASPSSPKVSGTDSSSEEDSPYYSSSPYEYPYNPKALKGSRSSGKNKGKSLPKKSATRGKGLSTR